MGISVILPAFNEEENLKILIPQLKEILSEISDIYELIVVDAQGSTDNSPELCRSLEVSYVKQKNKGYGDAFRLGTDCCRYEHILVVDTDNSQDISKIPEMYRKISEGADVVIGSRYTKGGTTDDPLTSVIMSKLLNFCFRIFLGFRQKDISTDFRIYDAKMLRSINTECENFDVIEETLFLLMRKFPDIVIKEVPICYKPRLEGHSKRKLLLFIRGYIRLLLRLIKIKKGD